MTSIRYKIVRYRREERLPAGSLITVEELARLTRVDPDMVVQFVRYGLVDPVEERPRILFHNTVVPRVRRILRLSRDLGINLAGVGLVLDLLERIEALERENARLRGHNR